MKKRVFLTGATGTMGFQGFKELYDRKHMYDIVILVRESKKAREMFEPFKHDECLTICWGDLTNYEDVLSCVTGSDYVLHVGGMVSPAADYYPKTTMKTNIGAMKNIIDAVKAQENPDAIKVVYIGTVAQTGDRNYPTHWGRTGDPIQISVYDHYAISKTYAEALLADSGLKYWVSLRQTGILYPDILTNIDPIMYHTPLNGAIEWATVEDSGRLLAKVCNEHVPQEFWRKFYNISSGSQFRFTNYEFEEKLLYSLGIKSKDAIKKLFEANWFILQNFHGHWFTDADKLDEILKFRDYTTADDYFKYMAKLAPTYYKLSGLAPCSVLKKNMMEPIAQTAMFGTQAWIKNGSKSRINAFYGSIQQFKDIGTWENFNVFRPTDEKSFLDHGYDESKDFEKLSVKDLQKAAQFRGGKYKTRKRPADIYTPVKWECAFGHEFEMSQNLALKGGHWCPKCMPIPWKYDEEAKVNPFFAQVWYSHHSKDENNVYDDSIYYGFGED
ncbi:MAG: NAD(P)-dependent oxidoreductase [Clostridia bacterium]